MLKYNPKSKTRFPRRKNSHERKKGERQMSFHLQIPRISYKEAA
jgi:hypothetical protein